MGRLTTHVLDTAAGVPGRGIPVMLRRLGESRVTVVRTVTNDDGRTDQPLLDDNTWLAGDYELEFAVAAYFRASGAVQDEPPFLDDIVIRFSLSGDGHYHVPLLVSPWSYSTYRGS